MRPGSLKSQTAGAAKHRCVGLHIAVDPDSPDRQGLQHFFIVGRRIQCRFADIHTNSMASSGDGPDGAGEAASHGQADFRAASRRARVPRRLHGDGVGRITRNGMPSRPLSNAAPACAPQQRGCNGAIKSLPKLRIALLFGATLMPALSLAQSEELGVGLASSCRHQVPRIAPGRAAKRTECQGICWRAGYWLRPHSPGPGLGVPARSSHCAAQPQVGVTVNLIPQTDCRGSRGF